MYQTFVNGQCGSGKTTQHLIPSVLKETKAGHKVCIVVPSVELQAQIAATLEVMNVNVEVINNTTTDKVADQIKYVFGPLSYLYSSKVVVITHAAFFLVADTVTTDEWIFHWDELPTESNKIVYKKNHNALESVNHTAFTNVDPVTNLCTLKKKTKDVKLDAQSDAIRTLYTALQSKSTEVYVDNDNDTYASFTVIYKPSFFPSNITFYGANVEHSLFYKIMKHFDPSIELINLTNKNSNHESNLINIFSSTETHLTKYLQENNPVAFNEIIKPLTDHIGNNRTLLLRNNICPMEFGTNYHTVSHNVHGINNLTDYNNVLLCSALNRSDEFTKVMEKFGITEFDILLYCTIETYYQVVARTAIRNNEQLKDAINIYIPCHRVAELLQAYVFPNANLIKLANITVDINLGGRPTVEDKLSNVETIKVSRMRKAISNNTYDYPVYVKYAFSTLSSREIVKLPWFVNYNSRGKPIKKLKGVK